MKAIVLCCAASLHEDMEAALKLFTPDIIVAVNHAGIDQPRVDHWASCHVDLFPGWLLERAANDLPAAGQLWVNETKLPNLSPAQRAFGFKGAPYEDGTSGELGCQVAMKLGCDRVVACGMPLINGPHFYDGPDFDAEKIYQRKWQLNLPKFGDKIRSMSGWSRDLLGYPTEEWLCFGNA